MNHKDFFGSVVGLRALANICLSKRENSMSSCLSDQTETFLKENKSRFVLFPIQHSDIWHVYKNYESNFWTSEETMQDLSIDEENWKTKLDDAQRTTIQDCLALVCYFQSKINTVNGSMLLNFNREVPSPELKSVLGFRMMNENFCAEIFQEFFSKWVSSQQAQSDAFQHIENLPSLVDAVDMVKRTQSKLVNFSERLVILLLVKTVILCTIFAALLKYKNILPTLAKAIELVIQDNIRFGECLVLCYLKLSNKLTKTQLKLLIQDASKVEIQLMTELNIRPSRKHESYTRQFVEFVSDFWAQKLDMENLFGATKNPLKWTTLFYKENDQEWQQLKASAQSTESSTPPVQLVSSSSSSVLATSTQIERQFSLDDDF